MNNLKEYILEKFKISKDITNNKYNIGDYTLTLTLYNWDSKSFNQNDSKVCIGIDVLLIKGMHKEKDEIKSLTGEYITTYHHTNTHGLVNFTNQNKYNTKYIYNLIYDFLIEVIIPEDEVLDILKYIKKNKTFNLIKQIDFCPTGFENLNKEIPVSFEKKDVTKITFGTEIDDLIKMYETNKFIYN